MRSSASFGTRFGAPTGSTTSSVGILADITDDATIAGTRADGDDDADPDSDPIRLGRYVLLHRLGAGSMGVVHAAYDEQLDRKVAIKLLRTRGSEQAQLRLVREAQALARLSHPNVVQIYEIAERPDQISERAYLVMEFVDGTTLSAWLAAGPRSQQAILDVFLAAGRGLAAAHAVNLVHRDFKPDNVLIRSDGRVLVADFGLAYADGDALVRHGAPELAEVDIASSSKLAEHLTATGAMMGTPAYMAPEQFLGASTDAQTDQFGFCVALWEALYGQRPFTGRDVAMLSMAVIAGEITKAARDDLPTWLRLVIERGLAREPSERWPSMQALLDALGRDPTRRRRPIALATVGLALVIVSALAIQLRQQHQRAAEVASCEREGQAITSDWNDEVRSTLAHDFAATELEVAESSWQSTQRWMDAYVDQWTTLRTQTCLATKVEHTRSEASHERVVACLDERRAAIAALARTWSKLDRDTIVQAPVAATGLPPLSACTNEASLARQLQPPEYIRGRVLVLREQLDRARADSLAGKFQSGLASAEATLIDAEALGWQPLTAETRLLIGGLQADAGQLEPAVITLERAGLDAVACGHDMVAVEVASTLAILVGSRLARHDQGLLWAELGLRLITRLELEGTAAEATMFEALSAVHELGGDYDEALVAERKSLLLREALFGPDHPLVADSLEGVGGLLVAKGQNDDALLEFRRSMAIRQRALGPDHVELALSHNNIGGVHMRSARLDEALVEFVRSRDLVELARGPDHIDLAPSYNNIGVIYWQQGKYPEALAAFDRAQTIQRAVLGPNHPNVAVGLDNIGNVLLSQGSYPAALAAHEQALAIREAVLGPEHADVAASLNNLGNVFAALGREDEALASFQRAQAIWTIALGPEHAYVASAMVNAADVSVRRGSHAEALTIYPRALAMFESSLGADHTYVAYPLVGIGRAQRALGELELARAALERALAIRSKTSGPPSELPEVQFELAQLDWAQGMHASAREYAIASRDGFRSAGQGSEKSLAEVVAWLAAHE